MLFFEKSGDLIGEVKGCGFGDHVCRIRLLFGR
jgi:hypothetical protein